MRVGRKWFAADPGRLRLRTAARAVLGVGLAVAAAYAAGLPLPAMITGGLAALLALFTVADPTVRAQALTTALLPVAGLPVLAAATALHDLPLVRDAVFLAVVLGGAYARRWGPRGHAVGIFAFMMFFVVQFLRAGTGQLAQIAAAVLLGLAMAAAVRFGAWCIERRTPPPAAVAAAAGRGLARVTTRQALQVTAACAIAMAVGHAVSSDRWYWAVGTAWWVFVNTASRGETLVRGFRRVLGTLVGIAAGLAVAVPIEGAPVPSAVVVAACVFGIFYTAAVSYSWMMFFVTVMVGVLYGLIGVLSPALLALRAEQTAVGALAAAFAVAAVLPVTTHGQTDAWVRRALECVHACTDAAARRLGGGAADPGAHLAEFELHLAKVRASLAPLLHPLNPFAARKARARLILDLLDECAAGLRGVVSADADHETHHERVRTALSRLHAPLEAAPKAPYVSAA
ncbi:FUSC family protein [Streptomyces sp. A7024]|uniref:FUSC family protein n=1 Tax=Streptomyces coryli TaxID=1128680 RepID=A0A6G4TX43_9ACTN|nr:FUSC family protein [Streptomyces coryli]NGN64454.1 FUSC family protein [Streptomyces coryli]